MPRDSSGQFDLTSHWRIEAPIESVCSILSDVERLPDWWGDVYLDVKVLELGDEDGIGRVVSFHSRGWLPYTLRWRATLVAADRPHSMTIRAEGDLQGQGEWSLYQDGEIADVRYVWRVDVHKPLLRFLSPVLKPVFAANHRWAMNRGEAGLRAEIAQRSGRA